MQLKQDGEVYHAKGSPLLHMRKCLMLVGLMRKILPFGQYLSSPHPTMGLKPETHTWLSDGPQNPTRVSILGSHATFLFTFISSSANNQNWSCNIVCYFCIPIKNFNGYNNLGMFTGCELHAFICISFVFSKLIPFGIPIQIMCYITKEVP